MKKLAPNKIQRLFLVLNHQLFLRFSYTELIKNFSFSQNQNMVRADVFNRFFGSFYRCGSAAFSEFCGGLSSPPAAAGSAPTIFKKKHHLGNFKRFWFASLRSATNLYWIWG